ncbi:adenylate/guanylate cyclase domain-containing protein [Egicoccus sp. AB-alg2]|uniref:adenylate/guanylate cyclase domain-containing protein n=1 Tax=Egicoccus sp. AB-alg2 TaxID=3242693 RepID=UPI00359EE3D3
MSADPATLLATLQRLEWGVAVVSPDDWLVEFENATFFRWFPPTQDDTESLAGRLPGLREERARARLEDGQPFKFETEVKDGVRSVSLQVVLRPFEIEDQPAVLVEAHDTSKQKEAEYMLDSYSQLAERNARELQREKERVEKLLLNIMPRSVFDEMTEFGTVTPQRFDDASIMMLDFVQFTSMAVSRDPSALVAELNDIFTAFDRIVELFGGERLKTIGDAYLAVAGIPDPSPDHARNLARVALRIRRYLERRNASHPEQWLCRIGLDTGPVIGSIVGVQKYVYDIFGPGVNLAARLESLAEPMQILVSEPAYQLIRNDFVLTDLGIVEVKGFGPQQLYSLDREEPRR